MTMRDCPFCEETGIMDFPGHIRECSEAPREVDLSYLYQDGRGGPE